MNAATFYKLCLSLWGEEWRPELMELLRAKGVRCASRQTYCNWRNGLHPVPDRVAEILKQEKQKRRRA